MSARRSDDPLLCVMLGLAAFVVAAHLETAVQAAGTSLALGAALLAISGLIAWWSWRLWQAPSRMLLGAGAALFVLLAAVWICSRTTGLPLGLSRQAPVGPLDGATALDELLLAAWALLALTGRVPRSVALPGAAFTALSGSFVLLSMGCGVGTAAAAGHQAAAGQSVALLCHLF